MTGVSVVIPVKDDGPRLRRCLRALAMQTRPPDEIVVVDNGSTDDSADIDLTVVQADSCDPDDATGIAGQSGTASGEETVTLRNPAPGTYIANVNGFSAGATGSPIAYAFDFWDVDAGATAGGLAVSPNPVPVKVNTKTSVTASWTGLAPGSAYLGFLSYAGSRDLTILEVTTP